METFGLRKHVPLTGQAHEVKIDRYNRCILVDNQPFFPIGVVGLTEHLYTPKRAYHDRQTELCREAGINTVMEWIYYRDKTPEEEALAERRLYFESLSAQGLKIIAKSYNSNTLVDRRLGFMYANPHFRSRVLEAKKTTLPAVIEVSRANPNLLAYYHFDEPTNRDFEDVLEAWADGIRELDPYHPVYMSLTRRIHAPNWFGTVTDLLGAHNYWFVMNPESFIRQAEFMANVNEAAIRAGSPTMHVLQLDGWGWQYGDGGLMTPLEQRASSFLALIHGARSLLYFSLPFCHQESVATQNTISRDIQALAPALLTREPQQEVLLEPAEAVIKANSRMFPVIQTRLLRDPNGEQVLLAINMAREPVTASFGLPSLANQKSVRDRIGAQKVSAIAEGVFTDTIEGLGVRAYAWKPDSFAGDDMPVQIKIKVSGPGVDWALAGAPWAEPKPRGKNLLKNSSFEEARMEGVPDYWLWPVGSGPLPPDSRAAGLETNNPFHGVYCYRLPWASTPKTTPWESRLMSDNIGALKVGKTYTVSLYARADKPSTPIEVWLQSYGNRGKFTIGTEWQRVSFSEKIVEQAGGKRYYLSASYAGKEPEGVVYFDAIQLEEAETASEYEP